MLQKIVEILMDLVDLNTCWNFSRQFNRCRDPYGSRGSKLHELEEETGTYIVEILMDLVDLN